MYAIDESTPSVSKEPTINSYIYLVNWNLFIAFSKSIFRKKNFHSKMTNFEYK